MSKDFNKNKIIIFMVAMLLIFLALCLTLYIFFKPYPLKYINEIAYCSKVYNVPEEVIAGVIYAESGFNANAKSGKGAVGLMQLMPTTAKWLADELEIEFSSEKLYEPQYNINLGAYYLSYLFDKFNDLNTVLASYNAGEGNVSVWLISTKYSPDGKRIETTPYKQTNHYIQKVTNSLPYYQEKFAK